MYPPLACPFCHRTVSQRDQAFICPECNRSYPIYDGVPDFSTWSHYWNQVSPEQMLAILEAAKTHGYRYAVEKLLTAFTSPYMAGYVLGESRADFRCLLPITRTSSVLDLGAGWGAVSCTLAPITGTVAAVDTNPHTLRFVRIRAQQSGIGNLQPIRIDPLDDGRLPFPDDTFDIAIMNGVLEWVGEASAEVPPSQAQMRCLQEVRRILKPRGTLFVGIENRYGFGYFLGARDHSRVPYTSLMPRPVANAFTYLLRSRPYRTYTYSLRGYRRLLNEAGFADPEPYIALPSYRDPEYILPADDDRAIAFLIQRRSAHVVDRVRRRILSALFHPGRTAMGCKLLRAFSDSFLLIAEAAK
ncbi:MAG: methyltransferase domain-containing protein [Chthonomonadales bacterium]